MLVWRRGAEGGGQGGTYGGGGGHYNGGVMGLFIGIAGGGCRRGGARELM